MVDAVLEALDLHTGTRIDRASVPLIDPVVPVPEARYCVLCDEAQVLALFGCKDCTGLLMCLECKEAHLRPKFYRSHKIFDLDDSSLEQEEKCIKHPPKVIEFCCLECHTRACASCGLLDHSGHKLVTLQEGIAEERSKLDDVMSELQDLFVERLSEMTQRLADYKGDIAALKTRLNSQTDALIAMLDEQRRVALAEIDFKATGPLQRLGAEKAAVEKLVSRCHSCSLVARRLRQEGSGSEIYELSPVSSRQHKSYAGRVSFPLEVISHTRS